jgi:hypothetical protein
MLNLDGRDWGVHPSSAPGSCSQVPGEVTNTTLSGPRRLDLEQKSPPIPRPPRIELPIVY